MPTNIILPVGITRFVVIHYHILKNAGTTIEYLLNRAFGDAAHALHGNNQSSVLDGATVAEYFLGNPNVVSLTSHHFRYPKPVIPQTVVFDICFLRDPIDRFHSFYKHVRRGEDKNEITLWAKKLAADKFFETLIEQCPHLVNNPQVVILANAGEYTRPADETDLAKAAEIVRVMAFPGIVDMFDVSSVSAEYFLRPAFPQLELHNVKQNVGPLSQLCQFKAELGKKTLRKLQERNRLDERLVELTRKEIARRSRLIPNLKLRLAEFHARSLRLDSNPETSGI